MGILLKRIVYLFKALLQTSVTFRRSRSPLMSFSSPSRRPMCFCCSSWCSSTASCTTHLLVDSLRCQRDPQNQRPPSLSKAPLPPPPNNHFVSQALVCNPALRPPLTLWLRWHRHHRLATHPFHSPRRSTATPAPL